MLDYAQQPLTQVADEAELLSLAFDQALARLNARAVALPGGLRFAEQDAALAADGLSYEQRIGERGLIAMRRDSLHDVCGALMWLRWPAIKWAIHRGQYAGIQAHGPRQRSRHQQALTHLDEAGLLVVAADADVLEALYAHQWRTLLLDRRERWAQARVHVLGHALLEVRALRPHDLLAAKVIAVQAAPDTAPTRIDQWVGEAILAGIAGADPKDLPTLPLAAVPGWDARNQDPDFIASAPCFRPKPPGRVYAAPLLPNSIA